MKILFVAMQYIHSVRWINQLKDSGHEIYVFDCLDKPIHPELRWTIFTENWSKRKVAYIKGEYKLQKKYPTIFEKIEPILKVTASEKLQEFIMEIQPDLVHSLEMQSETYPVLKTRNKIEFNWAYSSWGSDIYLYQNQKTHQKKMIRVFSKLNYLFSDNFRDLRLAENLGFKNMIAGVFPGGGGYNLESFREYKKPASERKLILIKGYHHWAGKALVVLNALELIIEKVRHYDIYVYSAHDIVVEKIIELNTKHNLTIQYSSRYAQITHTELLVKFGEAKIAIGNNSSDGIPNTLLEAIAMGAFPIQSNPGGASEDFIEDGKNGLLINNPEDSIEIAKIIEIAIDDDDLIISAKRINSKIAEKKLDYNIIKEKVVNAYAKIASEL